MGIDVTYVRQKRAALETELGQARVEVERFRALVSRLEGALLMLDQIEKDAMADANAASPVA